MRKYTLRPRLGTLDVRYADGAVDRVPWTMFTTDGLILRPSAAGLAVCPRLPRRISFNSGRQGNTARRLLLRATSRALKDGRFSDCWRAPSTAPVAIWAVFSVAGLAFLGFYLPTRFLARLGTDERLRPFLPQHYELICVGVLVLFGVACLLFVGAMLAIAWPHLRQALLSPRPLAFGISAAWLRVDFDDGSRREFPWAGIGFVPCGVKFGDDSRTTFLITRDGRDWRLRLLRQAFDPQKLTSREETRREILRVGMTVAKWFAAGWVVGSIVLTIVHFELPAFPQPLWAKLVGWTAFSFAFPALLMLGPLLEWKLKHRRRSPRRSRRKHTPMN